MHIVDGVLSAPVLAAGIAATAAGTAIGLRAMRNEQLPLVALLSATFFVASLIHFPLLGVTSIHLMLNGLMGILLGWMTFPATLVALLLQAVFFGFGGIIVLGVNTFNVAMPAVIIGYFARRYLPKDNPKKAFIIGGTSAALAVFFSSLLVALSLVLAGEEFHVAAQAEIISNLPIMALEFAVVGSIVALLIQSKPAIFHSLEHA